MTTPTPVALHYTLIWQRPRDARQIMLRSVHSYQVRDGKLHVVGLRGAHETIQMLIPAEQVFLSLEGAPLDGRGDFYCHVEHSMFPRDQFRATPRYGVVHLTRTPHNVNNINNITNKEARS